MTKKSNTSLGRDWMELGVAVVKLLTVVFEFLTKVVSYGRRHSKFCLPV